MQQEIEALTFEESYARLDEVIEALESGNRPLHESLALYEEGVRLAAQCEQQLRAAELRLTELIGKNREEGSSEDLLDTGDDEEDVF
ncbi:MAG: exodeoxyribonuclease VII small subunit [Anaerolineae bacterium]|jgi:exodeoxyribonuclease VII small subunit